MPNHDQYDKDILKQLTRIANSLDKIERKMPNNTFEPGSTTDGKEECITRQSRNVEHIQFEG